MAISENTDRSVGYSDALKSQDPKNHDSGEANPCFSMGWTEDKVGKKSTKSGKRKNSKGVVGEGKTVDGPGLITKLKRGTWTRLTNRPNMEAMSTDFFVFGWGGGGGVEDPKCKPGVTDCPKDFSPSNEKKLKVDDETKKLSVLFATHLGSVEVVEQPRRVQ